MKLEQRLEHLERDVKEIKKILLARRLPKGLEYLQLKRKDLSVEERLKQHQELLKKSKKLVKKGFDVTKHIRKMRDKKFKTVQNEFAA